MGGQTGAECIRVTIAELGKAGNREVLMPRFDPVRLVAAAHDRPCILRARPSEDLTRPGGLATPEVSRYLIG